jgi:hypothetical protein
MIRHLVALKFHDRTSEAAKAALMHDLARLSGQIDGILGFEVRRNVSPEDPVVRGFRDLFWFDFRDAGVRDAYLVHPAHRAVGARLVAACEGGADGIFVCDFAP